MTSLEMFTAKTKLTLRNVTDRSGQTVGQGRGLVREGSQEVPKETGMKPRRPGEESSVESVQGWQG